jgi:hypothetical protein
MNKVLDKKIDSKELNKWLIESIESLERQRANIDGQIMALDSVRKIQCLDMDIAHNE